MSGLDTDPADRTEDYVLVRTDAVGLRRFELETEDPERLESRFRELAPTLGAGDRLDAVKRSTEILFSAVGVDPEPNV